MGSVIEHGVCRLALVSVRADEQPSTEQTSQLLFGDHYEVMQFSKDRRMTRIRIHADQFEGWIDTRQHHLISPEYFDQISNSDYRITTDIASPVLFRKVPLTIVMGSIVPFSNSELFKVEEQFAFNGESKSLGQRRDFEFLASIAKKYQLAPELAGGKSPFGLDAAAFIQMVFRISGYPLQREVKLLAGQGKKVKSFADAKPGDIAFFAGPQGEVNHAGLILEEDKVIHVYGHVRQDRLTEEGILNPETKVYSHLVHSIRRLLP